MSEKIEFVLTQDGWADLVRLRRDINTLMSRLGEELPIEGSIVDSYPPESNDGPKEKTVHLSVPVPESLHRALREKCFFKRVPMAKVGVELFREWEKNN